jgi:drug/metabolite transporter (DMT)-like permease
MKEVLAIVIALSASFCVNYSTYMQKKAVDALPRLRLRLSRTVIRTFITNRPWLVAMSMDALGTGLFMVALIFLPVSIVEPIVTAGIALLAYLAIKNLGEKPSPADFFAIGITALGVILLAVSLAEGLPKGKTYNPLELWAVTCAVVIMAVSVPLTLHLMGRGNIAAALGVSGGLFIGIAAVFSRLLMGNFGGQWYIWLPACVLTYPLGFFIFQAGLQRGRAVVVAPIYNGLVVCVPIIVGTIALNERFPESPVLFGLRVAAFALIAFGAVVLSRRTVDVTTGTENSNPSTNELDGPGGHEITLDS